MPKTNRWGKNFKDKRDWVEYNSKLIKRGEWFFDFSFLESISQELREMNKNEVSRPFVGNDGSGIKVSNSGEWMRQKWQVRGGWIKAVITVDVEKKKILDIEVFEKGDSEPNIFERHVNDLVKQGAQIRKACADGVHDKRKLFNALEKHKIEHAIKPRSNASTKARGSASRAREVRKFKELGYEDWAKEKEYGMRWATEGKFSCVKRKSGEYVRSAKKINMIEEARRKFVLYDRMMAYPEA